MSEAVPRVAALIVTRNRRADLLETLGAVERLRYPLAAVELLVLDNASTDGTEEAVRAWTRAGGGASLARSECLHSALNLGAAGARNALAARVSPATEFLFVLDDDAVPEPALLERLVTTMSADRDLGIVGARIVAWDDPGRELAGAGYVDWRWGRFSEIQSTRAVDCDFVITCAAVIRVAAFRAAGGFDEDYFVYHEDVDFCVRLGRRGFRVRYDPAVTARHKVPAGKTRTPERLYYILRNKLLFLRKHLPPARHPLAWALYGAGLLPRMMVQSVVVNRGVAFGELSTIVVAGWHGLRGRTGAWTR